MVSWARDLIRGFADISSMALDGVLLAIIVQKVSAEEGFEPAVESGFWSAPAKIGVK